MNILSVGSLSGDSNTCLHRHIVLKKFADHIDEVNTNINPCSLWYRIAYHLFIYGLPVKLPENNNENEQIVNLVKKNKYDIIWIDKGNTINKETLEFIKQNNPKTKIISFSPDNMIVRINQSQNFLECVPLYDYHVTTKSHIINDLKKMGAKNVILAPKGFNPLFHKPMSLNKNDLDLFGGDVGFVGTWENERCNSLIYLANNGIKVKVFGGGRWKEYVNKIKNLDVHPYGLYDTNYVKSLQAFKISLCFLRKINNDQITARSIEIPACGGFMLAERTKEHLQMFKENEEAVFFSTNEELLEKCKYYLSNENERNRIALNGRKRCINSDYSNDGLIKNILTYIKNDK